mmetsp:Transcript_75489/g.151743  ORF Transcript_75489/g.151743 Transcript_75489/m.151743 type:complete len:267 (+) Transcript_75489:24-824(+)|eukprot:CAMPEP_0171878740 /NCGR_PEP_ID=MMETSP0992-20121227/37465_1 /TAXON_ID=483369 /ORGANISM="non described non described, Strain CCMP2098" /LENGTH=266 /DNA_ID=CAMNT_0012504225 /DNA_START=23 /DNA_END=823 /DNA_ORIENTATION=+
MHNAITPYSYMGFKPWSDIVPPDLKPGETLDGRDNKFKGVGNGVVYRDAPPREVPRDLSNQGLTLKNVKPEDYQVPDKKGLSAAWVSSGADEGRRKKFVGRSTYADAFQDPRGASAFKTNEPEWLVESKKVVPELLTREPPLASSHQLDFGKHPQQDAPREKAYMYMSGMASTTTDLGEATSKQVFHLPGYGGTIPANLSRNPVAREQGLANFERPRPGNLRQIHRHNMVGYTGYAPRDPKNDHGEMQCGSNPASTAGAMHLNLML